MSQSCQACRNGVESPMHFSMAFQPIINVDTNRVFAYEALVRGPNGEGAASILGQVTEQNRYAFDQNCRVKAITLAGQLGLTKTDAKLSINFMPGAVYSPAACVQLTLATAREQKLPLDSLIFEFTEREEVQSPEHLQRIADEYKRHGFALALDDFGAGYSNVNLLARLHTGIVKLDMDLTRDLHRRPRAQVIVRSLVRLCRRLGAQVVGEGIETFEEYRAVRQCGIRMMQGYFLAKPAFERLPDFELPRPRRTSVQALDLPPMLNVLPAASGI
ncbi:EAL domain-containing protein [Terriglobus sp.]|uniref:EAL domain-containing protein n=1 Tax=Terriglobus sp. TaxID=1889013 RepID=UPI003B00AE6A